MKLNSRINYELVRYFIISWYVIFLKACDQRENWTNQWNLTLNDSDDHYIIILYSSFLLWVIWYI